MENVEWETKVGDYLRENHLEKMIPKLVAKIYTKQDFLEFLSDAERIVNLRISFSVSSMRQIKIMIWMEIPEFVQVVTFFLEMEPAELKREYGAKFNLEEWVTITKEGENQLRQEKGDEWEELRARTFQVQEIRLRMNTDQEVPTQPKKNVYILEKQRRMEALLLEEKHLRKPTKQEMKRIQLQQLFV